MQKCEDCAATYYPLIGRILIAVLFIAAGYEKLMDVINNHGAYTIMAMNSVGIPFAGMTLLILTIVLELLGGIMLVVGYKTKWTGIVLALFTIVATYYFHFSKDQLLMALKNLSIIGGLLYVSGFGAGVWSVDSWFAKRKQTGMTEKAMM